jgi:heme exporter protein D
MQWNSLGEFLAMGGYAFYVWSSLGLVALCMAVEPWLLLKRRKAILDRLPGKEPY